MDISSSHVEGNREEERGGGEEWSGAENLVAFWLRVPNENGR